MAANALDTSEPSTWRAWLRTPTGTVAALGLVVAVLFGVWQVVEQARPSTPEEHLQACRQRHEAPRSFTVESGQDPRAFRDAEVTTVHGLCAWPPVTGASEDGYYEIHVGSFALPGTSGADEFTSIDVLNGPCDKYRVEYFFDNQGVAAQMDPMTLRAGQLVSVHDGSPKNSVVYEDELPDGYWEGLSILTHFRYSIADLACLPD